MPKNASTTNRDPSIVGRMFDDIAPTYDRLNHILSLGWDLLWRRKMVRCIQRGQALRVIDLATGTGDLLIALLQMRPDIEEVTGLDISEKMMAVCQAKLDKRHLDAKLVRGDVLAMPFPADSFDAATMAFGIRNATDVPKTLTEIHRILKPGGMAWIMEFSLPGNRVVRWGYLAYLRWVVPVIGSLVSGNKQAYRYLNTSIEGFHGPSQFCALMKQAGFTEISATPLTFGVASIYRGRKP